MAVTQDFQPVFVVGYPRSGTTLLLHILMSSGVFPQYTFTETHFFSHYYRRYGALHTQSNRDRFLHDFYRSEAFVKSGVIPLHLSEKVDSQKPAYENYLRAFMELIAIAQEKNRWLEKTPWHMLYIREIARAFPSAQFIHIIRDPRDVVLSVSNAGWAGRSPGALLKVAAAWGWHIEITEKTLEALPERAFTIRYEDLVGIPAAAINELGRFLKIDVSYEQVVANEYGVLRAANTSSGKAIKGLSAVTVTRWKKDMAVETLTQIEYLLQKKLHRYGYETSSSTQVPLGTKIKLKGLQQLYHLYKLGRAVAFPYARR